MAILGINAFHGDSSAAVFAGGQLIAAIEEERLNRIKHWAGFPSQSISFCLAAIDPRELTDIAISRDPKAHFGAKLIRAAATPSIWPRLVSRSKNSWRVAQLPALFEKNGMQTTAGVRFHNVEHHRAHLASAFFCSPFEEAAVLSVDGFGDFSSVMWGIGRGNQMEILGSVRFPHSLGIFYTAFTQYLGFPKYGDEYKMMGLAAYGVPSYIAEVREVVNTNGFDCRLNLDYFTHHTKGVEMSWENGEPHLGAVYSRKMLDVFGEPRRPRTEIEGRHADLAASVQAVLEENYFELLNAVQRATGLETVCLAGGVALNCAANGKIFERTPFRDVYIQPAAHDAGTSIGAALYVQHQILRQPRKYVMEHVYFGPDYTPEQVRSALDDCGTVYHAMSRDALVAATAREIAAGKIVGWFQGRMEFGPRALGNRSILADPTRREMKDTLNSRIKYREPFRPFCPSILAEATGEFFEIEYPSPFMVQAYRIKPARREQIPAVTHADGTGRLQTVHRDVNPLYWRLIDEFRKITGVPVLLNTSFNENEPIVATPRQAVECFLRTQMDVLVAGPYMLHKSENMHRTGNRQAFAEAELSR